MSREYHVLKGVTYKQGLIPAMLVDTADKNKEWNKDDNPNYFDPKEKNSSVDKKNKGTIEEEKTDSNNDEKVTKPKNSKETEISTSIPPSASTSTSTGVSNSTSINRKETAVSTITADQTNQTIKKAEPTIKKGFLSNSKSSVYPESVTAKNKSVKSASPNIILPGNMVENYDDISGDSNIGLGVGVGRGSKKGGGSLVQELTPGELKELKKTGSIAKAKVEPNPKVNNDTQSSGVDMTEHSTSAINK
jgi:hypothetical protein